MVKTRIIPHHTTQTPPHPDNAPQHSLPPHPIRVHKTPPHPASSRPTLSHPISSRPISSYAILYRYEIEFILNELFHQFSPTGAHCNKSTHYIDSGLPSNASTRPRLQSFMQTDGRHRRQAAILHSASSYHRQNGRTR